MKLLTGKQIKRKRAEHNLTQKELGLQVEAVDPELRCKPSYLSFIEGGFRPADLKVIEVLTTLLSAEPSAEAKQAVAEKKARAKARKTRARRSAAKATT